MGPFGVWSAQVSATVFSMNADVLLVYQVVGIVLWPSRKGQVRNQIRRGAKHKSENFC